MQTLHRFLAACGAVLAMAAAIAAPDPEAAGTPLVLAVQPYLSAPEIQQRFAPLARYLAEQTGRRVTVRVGTSYAEHIRFIGEDRVDLAYSGPNEYVEVVDHYGPKPLLARFETNGKPYLRGVIFVRDQSPVHTLADLKGKRIAFVSKDSTAGNIIPRFVLFQGGIRQTDFARSAYLGSHEDVALGVVSGDFDAGAMCGDYFDEVRHSRGLRIVADLPEVSEFVFIARASMPAAEVAHLRQSLLNLRGAPGGLDILQSIAKGTTGLVPARDADYSQMRTIKRALAAAEL